MQPIALKVKKIKTLKKMGFRSDSCYFIGIGFKVSAFRVKLRI